MKIIYLLTIFILVQSDLFSLDIKFSNESPKVQETIKIEIDMTDEINGDFYLISYRFKDSTDKPLAESILIQSETTNINIESDDNFILFKLIDSEGNVFNNKGDYWHLNIYDNNGEKKNSKLNEAITYLGAGSSNYSRTPNFNKINTALVAELENYPDNIRANIAYETFKLDFKLIDFNEYKNNIEIILNTKININDELTVRSVITALNSIDEAKRAIDLEEQFIDNVMDSELQREYKLDEISNADDYDEFIEKSIKYLNKYKELDKIELVQKSFAYAHTQSKEYYENIDENLKKLDLKNAILFKYLALGMLKNSDLNTDLGSEKYLRDLEINLKNAFGLVNDLDSIKPKDLSLIEFEDYKEKIRSDLFLISYRLDLLKNDSASAYQSVYEAINKAPYQMNSRLYKEAIALSSEFGSTANTKEIIKQAYYNDVVDSNLEEIILETINNNNDINIEFINQLLKEKQEKLRIQIKKDLVTKPISGIVKSLNGKYNDLSVLTNKIHIISITSTWCDVCEETFPTLNKISNKYSNTELIGISVWGDEDEENQLVKIINENDIGYKYYLDNTDVIPRKFDLFGFPTILIVDANNKLRYTVRGFNSEESLENIIDTVIDLIK